MLSYADNWLVPFHSLHGSFEFRLFSFSFFLFYFHSCSHWVSVLPFTILFRRSDFQCCAQHGTIFLFQRFKHLSFIHELKWISNWIRIGEFDSIFPMCVIDILWRIQKWQTTLLTPNELLLSDKNTGCFVTHRILFIYQSFRYWKIVDCKRVRGQFFNIILNFVLILHK